MKKQVTKKQHYVPQFYLRNFTDKDGFIHVYNRKNKTFFKSTPKDICKEDFQYEVEWKNAHPNLMQDKFVLLNKIEKYLAANEKIFNELTNKIIRICSLKVNENSLILSGVEKETLRSFVSNMYVRHPTIYKEYKNFYINDEALNCDELSLYKEILDKLGLGGFKSIVSTAVQRAAIDESIKGGYSDIFSKILESLNFAICTADDCSFITSSMPVSKSIENGYTYVVMPLTPKHLILFTDSNEIHSSRNRVLNLEKQVVDSFNKQNLKTVPDDVKFFISNNKSSLEKLVLQQ